MVPSYVGAGGGGGGKRIHPLPFTDPGVPGRFSNLPIAVPILS